MPAGPHSLGFHQNGMASPDPKHGEVIRICVFLIGNSDCLVISICPEIKAFMQPMKVEPLARHFGVSVSYLEHEFKKYTNRSVYDYILYRRVMLAKKLIPGCSSLNAISEQCGFENYSNFMRLFYKYVGTSPNAYKKSMKQCP